MQNNSNAKILVIEDEAPVRANIIELLEAENFKAIAAEDGEQGITKAQAQMPDLIICDIMMPDMDGYTVLTELQKDPLTAAIPFIFLTAKAERDDQRLGMELGADDYITKPCSAVELLSAVTIRLKKRDSYRHQYIEEIKKAKGLQQRVQQLQQLSNSRDELLQKISEDLRDPLSNITMAIQMLKIAPNEQARARYLIILQEACARELAIINQISSLQELLNIDKANLVKKFNITSD